jgi:hypothetical protein
VEHVICVAEDLQIDATESGIGGLAGAAHCLSEHVHAVEKGPPSG